jgi:8-oxo-dGTP pyrophosphatase MutT (NUDIX family)
MTAARRWRDVWTAPGERLFVQARDEEGWTRHRILSNSEGDGAVAVVVDGSRVLFIDAERPAIGRNLWELPRGQADAADGSPEATAARELLEETGLIAVESRLLGQIWAESGLSGDAVNVVQIRVDPRAKRAVAEHSALRWIDMHRISQEIADDQIRDGISIAALALAWAKGELSTASPA